MTNTAIARKRGRPLGSTNKKIDFAKKSSLIPSKIAPKPKKDRPTAFKKGWSGGPGRPQGSRNKVSIMLDEVGDKIAIENAVRAYKHMVALSLGEADKGDISGCKYIYEAACPPRKGARVNLGYEAPLKQAKTAKEINYFSEKVTLDMLEGIISVEEAEGFCKVLDHRLKILTDVDVLRKIEETCTRVDSLYTDR